MMGRILGHPRYRELWKKRERWATRLSGQPDKSRLHIPRLRPLECPMENASLPDIARRLHRPQAHRRSTSAIAYEDIGAPQPQRRRSSWLSVLMGTIFRRPRIFRRRAARWETRD